MNKPILVANWKNHPESMARVSALLAGLARKSSVFKRIQTYIAPPMPYMDAVGKRVRSFASLATQDIFFASVGTYTGAVTPEIFKSFNVKLSIIGHSERRGLGETNEVVSAKVKVALRNGITPLICIGEAERDADGAYFEFLREELKMSLEGIRRKEDAHKLVIAYEPIWAIGKKAKDAMQPSDVKEMVMFIKKVLTEIFGRESAEKIPVIYGGSVEAGNAMELHKTGIKGFLVGHDSLIAQDFAKIAETLSSK